MKGIHWHRLLIAVGLVCGASVSVAADIDIAPELPLIVYIGTNDFPLENADVAATAGVSLGVYNLDAQRNLENHLMEGLPKDFATMGDVEPIQRIIEQRLDKLPQQELMAIFQPIMLVQRWDIRKTPAFVFGNGAAVMYGLTDAAVALDYWHEWRAQHPRKGEGAP